MFNKIAVLTTHGIGVGPVLFASVYSPNDSGYGIVPSRLCAARVLLKRKALILALNWCL
jgi:hypothetical protein